MVVRFISVSLCRGKRDEDRKKGRIKHYEERLLRVPIKVRDFLVVDKTVELSTINFVKKAD